MEAEAYAQFTQALTRSLATDPRVLGLVALGSMAQLETAPDRWSDHDFFVITVSGMQEFFRTDLSWLPAAGRIAFWFRETMHGVKVVYDDGHLLEFAVFDDAELDLAAVNRYRVLLDRDGLAGRMAEIRQRTTARAAEAVADERRLFGLFLTHLMVGAARFCRGERLSGRQFTTGYALEHLARLLARYVPSPQATLLDNLSPLRRLEQVYPGIAAELEGAMLLDSPAAALCLLDIADRELAAHMPDFRADWMTTARHYVEALRNE